MPGDRWQQLANLRAFYAFMWAHPGKKLIFMGGELAQEHEWDHERALDWPLLDVPGHRGIQTLVRDLNHRYRAEPALWSGDDDPDVFSWLDGTDADHNVFAFIRHDPLGVVPWCASRTCHLFRAHEYGIAVSRPQGCGRRSSTPTPASTAAPTSATGASRHRGTARRRWPPPARAAAPRRALAGAARREPVTPYPRLGRDRERRRRHLHGLGTCGEARAARHRDLAPCHGAGTTTARGPSPGPERHGDRYRFCIDATQSFPDPMSCAQPEGVLGPSEVVDPGVFAWTDEEWRGVVLDDLVLYELHVGTFTEAGTFAAAVDRLPELADLGITAIELMPVATFPGRFGWGYDGLYTSAPHPVYGGPEGLALLVDRAHAVGLGVVLDVVYNHFGPGAERAHCVRALLTDADHDTFWGAAVAFVCRGVREWAIQNAEHWVRDLHVDGLRLDAVHAIVDETRPHIVAELGDRVRALPRHHAGDRGDRRPGICGR